MRRFIQLLLILLSNLAFGQTEKTYLFVGTYTNQQPDKGIYVFEFNSTTGDLKPVSSGQNITNPSFITISTDGNFIYACTDTKMPNAGSVSAFRFDSISGSLTFINKQPSGGENPVYVTTNKNNEFIVCANYTTGTVSVFTTNPDGSLNPFVQSIAFEGKGINQRRQEKAHIHAAVFSPDFHYIFFPDLGSDKIRTFQFDCSKPQPLTTLEYNNYQAIPGSGPRHFTFHPKQKFAYCIEELSGTVTAFKYDNGQLDSIQRIFAYSKLQEDYNSADIHISPDGLFLYASNRWDNENTLAIFSIDAPTGKLTLVGHQSTFGDSPRNFTLDPSGHFLIVANQVTNNLVVFKRNTKTGLLTRIGQDIKVPNPSCLKMRRYNF